VFGITKGKVLGCLVSTKGIEANHEKIRAITQMQPPAEQKGRTKAHRSDSFTESVYLKAGRA
jgi:hypothetical protein